MLLRTCFLSYITCILKVFRELLGDTEISSIKGDYSMKKDLNTKSKVYLMCGPAGSGKSTLAKKFENQGMTVLSYDKESFKQGIITHPLPDDVKGEIKKTLDEQMISLIRQKKDIILDYSFWSKEMRSDYLSLLRTYDIEPIIYYVKTPKKICLERIRNRKGKHPDDILLTTETASLYYDTFQSPTTDEGDIVVVHGYNYT